MHRIRHPRDGASVVARSLKQGWQCLADARCPHAGDEGQAPVLAVRVETVDKRTHLLGRGRGAELNADGVAHARQQLNVSAFLLAGALSRPQEVGGRVVGFAGARVDARHRRLVLQEECLVRGIEVNVAQGLKVDSRRPHEFDGPVNVLGQRFVARVRGVGHEPLIPAMHLAKIRVSALRERADQVERRGRMVVQRQEPLRVGFTCVGSELDGVHGVAAVAGKSHPVSRLRVGRPGLGVLSGDAPHFDDGQRRSVGQDDGHLQERLDLEPHVVGRRLREGLRAVPAHQDESLAAPGGAHPGA